MDRLMQANLQIIELLGAVFEEAERQGTAASRRPARPSPLRVWVGRPRPGREVSRAGATN